MKKIIMMDDFPNNIKDYSSKIPLNNIYNIGLKTSLLASLNSNSNLNNNTEISSSSIIEMKKTLLSGKAFVIDNFISEETTNYLMNYILTDPPRNRALQPEYNCTAE
jgi:hypothetical protein